VNAIVSLFRLVFRQPIRTALLGAVLFALSSHPAAAQSRGPLELATAPVAEGAIPIAYGSDAPQFGELRLPEGAGPHPVAVIVHGGCWLARLGNLDERAVALDNMRPVASALSDAGIATWNVEYRRLGHEGGGWPGTFLDVAAATDFLRDLAEDHPLDLARVVTIGHSAGGHLAVWLAARGRISAESDLYTSNPLPLIGAINLDGPADLRKMLPLQERICGTPVITQLMDGTYDERPERYRDTSPLDLLPLRVPVRLFAGAMFAEQAQTHLSRARQAGDDVEAAISPEAGHFVLIDPETEYWPEVLRALQRLLGLDVAH
jgi:acetyl esterase/lipase